MMALTFYKDGVVTGLSSISYTDVDGTPCFGVSVRIEDVDPVLKYQTFTIPLVADALPLNLRDRVSVAISVLPAESFEDGSDDTGEVPAVSYTESFGTD